MKKIILFLLVCSFAVLAFTACGEPAGETSGNTIGNVSGDVVGNESIDTTVSTSGESKWEYTLSDPVEYDDEKDLVVGFRDLNEYVEFRKMAEKSDSEIAEYLAENFNPEIFGAPKSREDMEYVIGMVGNTIIPDMGPDFQFDGMTFWNKFGGELAVFYVIDEKIMLVDSYMDTSRLFSAGGEAFTDITVNGKATTLYWIFSEDSDYVFDAVTQGEDYLFEMKFPRMTADAIKANCPENIEVMTVDQYILKYWQ